MNDRVIIRNGCVVIMNDAGDVLFDGAVVLDGDRITDVGETRAVLAQQSTDGTGVIDAGDTTIIDGKIVMEDRWLTTVNEQKVLREANAAFRRVIERVGGDDASRRAESR
jgi:hypothetical protein